MSEKEPQTSRENEIQLILGCARSSLTPAAAARIPEILERNPDWDYIVAIAGRNGLLPLVCRNLLKDFGHALPDDVRPRLADFFQANARDNLFLSFKLTEIVGLLEENDIPVFSFKGPTLAMQAYGDPGLRQYVDLDILVQPRDFDKAIGVLSKNGYRSEFPSGPLTRKLLFFTRKKDVNMFDADGRVRVELHWKLSGSHFALPFELDRLWTRMDTMKLGGAEFRVLAFNDLFVYLCLHGSRHGWERLSWICDLHELIMRSESAGKSVDWREVRAHARDHGCEKVVELGLFLVAKFFGLRIDYPDIENCLSNEAYRQIAEKVRTAAFSEKQPSTEINDWYLFHLSLKERASDRIKVKLVYLVWYVKLIFKPNAADRSVINLPTVFYPLYFIMRPLRLAFNYLAGPGKKTDAARNSLD